MCTFGKADAAHQFPAGPLQPEPKNIWSQGDANRLGKNVDKARGRQPGNLRQIPQGQAFRLTELLAHEPEHTFDTRMHLGYFRSP